MAIPVPDHFKLQYDRPMIDARVAQLAHEISPWARACANQSGNDVVVIPVLRGAMFFFADLVRELSCSVEIAPAQSWRYDPLKNLPATAEPTIDIRAIPTVGRHLLIVDDICDSGVTLRALTHLLKESGAAEVRSAVLIRRQVKDPAFRPDWCCFEFAGEDWFVGYGMDDGGKYRNVPSVYVMQPQG